MSSSGTHQDGQDGQGGADSPASGASASADSEIERLKSLVDFIARALVELPGEVEVQDVDEDGGTVLELIVAEEDLGKVIGRQGRTARAIRTVLGAAAQRLSSGRRVSLEILE